MPKPVGLSYAPRQPAASAVFVRYVDIRRLGWDTQRRSPTAHAKTRWASLRSTPTYGPCGIRPLYGYS